MRSPRTTLCLLALLAACSDDEPSTTEMNANEAGDPDARTPRPPLDASLSPGPRGEALIDAGFRGRDPSTWRDGVGDSRDHRGNWYDDRGDWYDDRGSWYDGADRYGGADWGGTEASSDTPAGAFYDNHIAGYRIVCFPDGRVEITLLDGSICAKDTGVQATSVDVSFGSVSSAEDANIDVQRIPVVRSGRCLP